MRVPEMTPVVASAVSDDVQPGFVGQYEVDDAGVPYYLFPPWSQPPPGVFIVPFKAFKPVGIVVNDDGGEENDGAGIATVMLLVQHGENASVTGSKGAKKAQAEKDALSGVRLTWDQQWEETDRLAPPKTYNANETMADRLDQAIHAFSESMTWRPHLQSCFDHFKQFVGIITHPNQQHRTKKRSSDEEPDMSDDEDDEKEDVAPGGSTEPASFDPMQLETCIVELDDEETAAERHRQAVLNRFLDKPDHAMKVFLSSYFSAKGMLWEPAKLRDAPILMRCFINYLLKRGVLPEARKALERARAVTELAKVELPATSDMSKVLSPEKFGELCKRAWGVTFTAKNDHDNTTFEREPLPEKGDPAAMHAKSIQVDLNGHTVDFSSAAAEDALSGSGWDGAKTGGAGWGDAAASGWDTHESVQPEAEDWTQTGTPERPLSEWLSGVDPSFLKQCRSELSTRRLIRILPPNPGTTGSASQLATLIMGPWNCCFPNEVGCPQSLLNEGDSDWVPGEEEISVFVHPDVAEKVLPGFGLQCVWVQVREEKKSKGKKKSQSWWYVESHRAAFMTYWTVDELEEGAPKYQ